jgi:hypothetical protein
VLGLATTEKWREGANPAVWRGHLDTKLTKPSEVAKKEQRRKPMPFREVPAFMQQLRRRSPATAAWWRGPLLHPRHRGYCDGN